MGLRVPLTHSFFESPAVLRIRMLDRLPNLGRALGKYLPGIPLVALLVLFYRVTPEEISGLSDRSSFEVENLDLNAAQGSLNENQNQEELEFLPSQIQEASEVGNDPDVNAFIVVEQEPQALNMRDIKMAIGYPQTARDTGIEGNVVVRILVNEDGEYVRHVVLNGVHPVLEEAVSAQLPDLAFSPAIQEGEPVKFWVNIPFAFKLIK